MYTCVCSAFGAKVVLIGSICLVFREMKTLLIRKHIKFYKAPYLNFLGTPALKQIPEATSARHELLKKNSTFLDIIRLSHAGR